MDGRLLDKLYREVRLLSKKQVSLRRAGRPRVYGTDEVLMVFLLAAMMNWAVSVVQRELASCATGWWLRRHWNWPGRVPSVATLTRRAKQTDFRWLLRAVLRKVRAWMGRHPSGIVAMDGTFLLTGPYSRDVDSRWTCHGGKWFRGYALHAICDETGILWACHVTSANVQEMKAARQLIRRLSLVGKGVVRWIVGDCGYDSEPLHQLVRKRLKAKLLAPINTRGAKGDGWRKRQPGRDASDRFLQTKAGARIMSKRSSSERWNSWFKGTGKVSMLPYHVRGLRTVRRWVDLKLVVFFGHQYLSRQHLGATA
jgi:hypothetical protein